MALENKLEKKSSGLKEKIAAGLVGGLLLVPALGKDAEAAFITDLYAQAIGGDYQALFIGIDTTNPLNLRSNFGSGYMSGLPFVITENLLGDFDGDGFDDSFRAGNRSTAASYGGLNTMDFSSRAGPLEDFESFSIYFKEGFDLMGELAKNQYKVDLYFENDGTFLFDSKNIGTAQTPSPVPLPGTAALMLSGLLPMLAYARRGQNKEREEGEFKSNNPKLDAYLSGLEK